MRSCWSWGGMRWLHTVADTEVITGDWRANEHTEEDEATQTKNTRGNEHKWKGLTIVTHSYIRTTPSFIHPNKSADDRIQMMSNTKWSIFYHRSPKQHQSWPKDEVTEGDVCVNWNLLKWKIEGHPATDPSAGRSSLLWSGHIATPNKRTGSAWGRPQLGPCSNGGVSMRLLIIRQHADVKSTHPLRCSKMSFCFLLISPLSLSSSPFLFLLTDHHPLLPSLYLPYPSIPEVFLWRGHKR